MSSRSNGVMNELPSSRKILRACSSQTVSYSFIEGMSALESGYSMKMRR